MSYPASIRIPIAIMIRKLEQWFPNTSKEFRSRMEMALYIELMKDGKITVENHETILSEDGK